MEIKKNHMNPRIKRPPFPHITLLAPFVTYRDMKAAKEYLYNYLQHIEPFDLSFEKFEIFDNPGSSTLYLDPIINPPNALDSLYKLVSQLYPQSIEANRHGDNFSPHIGVGYFKDVKESKRLQAKYQEHWKAISFKCKEIYILSRVGEDPFEVREVVPLGKNSTPAYFECKPEY